MRARIGPFARWSTASGRTRAVHGEPPAPRTARPQFGDRSLRRVTLRNVAAARARHRRPDELLRHVVTSAVIGVIHSRNYEKETRRSHQPLFCSPLNSGDTLGGGPAAGWHFAPARILPFGPVWSSWKRRTPRLASIGSIGHARAFGSWDGMRPTISPQWCETRDGTSWGSDQRPLSACSPGPVCYQRKCPSCRVDGLAVRSTASGARFLLAQTTQHALPRSGLGCDTADRYAAGRSSLLGTSRPISLVTVARFVVFFAVRRRSADSDLPDFIEFLELTLSPRVWRSRSGQVIDCVRVIRPVGLVAAGLTLPDSLVPGEGDAEDENRNAHDARRQEHTATDTGHHVVAHRLRVANRAHD